MSLWFTRDFPTFFNLEPQPLNLGNTLGQKKNNILQLEEFSVQ